MTTKGKLKLAWLDFRVWLVKKILGPHIMIGWSIPMSQKSFYTVVVGKDGIVRDCYFRPLDGKPIVEWAKPCLSQCAGSITGAL